MKKTNNPNTFKKKITKAVVKPLVSIEQEFYKDMYSFSRHITDEYLSKLALEWVETAVNDKEMLLIDEYPIAKGIAPKTFERWQKKSPDLQEAHDHVLRILGARREKGAMSNKYNAAFVLRTMPMYSASFKELEEWRANLSAKVAQAGGGLLTVEIERCPDSPVVPKKKDKYE